MLGRIRRTSRLDVGLAFTFAGLAYLVWALVAGFSRQLVKAMLRATEGTPQSGDLVARTIRVVFLDAGFMIDVVGLLWLFGALALVVLASRQKISVSWSFVAAICQAVFAALGAVLVGWGVSAPRYISQTRPGPEPSVLQQVSSISLAITVSVAVTCWVVALVLLLIERARWRGRHRPTLRDSLRSSFLLSRRRA